MNTTKDKEYDPFQDPKKFWYGNVGCPGCYKGYYPDHPAPGQGPHMDPGGCLATDSSDEE
tara:strand:- start:201 stop:380 length:180 start_codon:yes stop_codon:yes gene_type:complete